MTSYLERFLIKIGEHVNELVFRPLSQSCLNNNLSNIISTVNKTCSPLIVNLPACDSSHKSGKMCCNDALVHQQNIYRSDFRRIQTFGASTGHTNTIMPCLNNSSNLRHFSHNSPQSSIANIKFQPKPPIATRDKYENQRIPIISPNNFSKSFDFPTMPIPNKMKSSPPLRIDIGRIAQNYMPIEPTPNTRNQFDKPYRKLRDLHRPLSSDAQYCFPLDTHIKQMKKEPEPLIDLGQTTVPDKNLNSLLDKISSAKTSKNKFWSIGDNYSFPSISGRLDIESAIQHVEDITKQNSALNLPNKKNVKVLDE